MKPKILTARWGLWSHRGGVWAIFLALLGLVLGTSYLPTHSGYSSDTSTDVSIRSKALNFQLYSWGFNSEGQLGVGDLVDHSPGRVGSESDWFYLSVGGEHACGIQRVGELYCWGSNNYGQLGTGDKVTQTTPTRIGSANDWILVNAAHSHTCGIRGTNGRGTLWCWGYNLAGRLGTGNETERLVPYQIGTDTDWTNVAAWTSSLGIRSPGMLFVWGGNTDGRIGLGSTTQQLSPLQIGTDTDWSLPGAGRYHACALKGSINNKALWCTGLNADGQLGVGDSTTRTTFTQVGANSDWSTVSAGQYHTGGIRNGQLYMWGRNSEYQLGVGDNTARNAPTRVGTASDWTAISASGWYHTCGSRGVEAYCWGENLHGELGDGTVNTAQTPMRILSSIVDVSPILTGGSHRVPSGGFSVALVTP